jgi:hypothetical protein
MPVPRPPYRWHGQAAFSLKEELQLVFHRSSHNCVQERRNMWWYQVSVLACLAKPERVSRNAVGHVDAVAFEDSGRIDILFGYLSILDVKFGLLFTIGTLLLVIPTVFSGPLFELAKNHAGASHPAFVWFVTLSSGAFILVWLIICGLCVSEMYLLIWGDLVSRFGAAKFKRTFEFGHVLKGLLSHDALVEEEEKQVERLITRLVRRTAKFRVGMAALGLLFVFSLIIAIPSLVILNRLALEQPPSVTVTQPTNRN